MFGGTKCAAGASVQPPLQRRHGTARHAPSTGTQTLTPLETICSGPATKGAFLHQGRAISKGGATSSAFELPSVDEEVAHTEVPLWQEESRNPLRVAALCLVGATGFEPATS